MSSEGPKKSVFVLGAGFIGLSVVDELLKAQYDVTALVRRQAHADQLVALGVSPLLRDLENSDLITKQSSVSEMKS